MKMTMMTVIVLIRMRISQSFDLGQIKFFIDDKQSIPMVNVHYELVSHIERTPSFNELLDIIMMIIRQLVDFIFALELQVKINVFFSSLQNISLI